MQSGGRHAGESAAIVHQMRLVIETELLCKFRPARRRGSGQIRHQALESRDAGILLGRQADLLLEPFVKMLATDTDLARQIGNAYGAVGAFNLGDRPANERAHADFGSHAVVYQGLDELEAGPARRRVEQLRVRGPETRGSEHVKLN